MKEATKGVLSKKNKYYIPKYRYYELKYYCLQYPLWKEEYNEATLYLKSVKFENDKVDKSGHQDPVYEAMLKRARAYEKIERIRRIATLSTIKKEASLYSALMEAVTKGTGWSKLQAKYSLTCTRQEYYSAYHEFFYILSGSRD